MAEIKITVVVDIVSGKIGEKGASKMLSRKEIDLKKSFQ